MASFDAFNFEADPRWQSYLNSVDILADPTSALQQLQRLKQKWYKKYVDPNFQIIGDPSTAATAPNYVNNTAPAYSAVPPSPANPAPGQQPSYWAQLAYAFMNYLQQGDNKWYFATFTSFVWSLLHVILFTISFHEESTRRYHSRALWGSMIGCILSIYSIVKPGGLTMENYMRQPMAHEFANYLAYCSIFLMAPPILLELLPIAILSVLAIATFAANTAPNLRDTPLGNIPIAQLADKVLQTTPTLKLSSAYAEIANVPILLFNVLFYRFSLIIQCLMYWHFLSQRYLFSPHTRAVLDKVAVIADDKFSRFSPDVARHYTTLRKYLRYFIDQPAMMRPHQQ
jgi:hypothetical protein